MQLTSNQVPGKGKGRYHRIDGWRGYTCPATAVAGSSDTGMASDSPCPSDQVRKELDRLKAALKASGISAAVRGGGTSNVFCGKRWLCVLRREDFPLAAQISVDWLREHKADTCFIHDAMQDQLGYKESADATH